MAFREVCIRLFQIGIVFLALFNLTYFIIVPLWALVRNLYDGWDAFFDILLGVSALCISLFAWKTVHTRLGFLLQPLIFVYWWLVPCHDLLGTSTWLNYPGTYILMGLSFLYLGFTGLIGILLFFMETHHLRKNHQSIIWGPWVSSFIGIRKEQAFNEVHRKSIRNALIITMIIIAMMIPGLIQFGNVYSVPIEITPGTQHVTFNFWATPDINATYDNTTRAEYNIGSIQIYNDSILDQLDNHSVNLDLTFGSFTAANITMLEAWETRCPHITYRIVLTPSQGLMYFT